MTKHLFLPGEHKGLINHKAAFVYSDELILTEAPFDSLALIQGGIENTIPCYGTNGFTKVHLQTLKAARVKAVCIAFDNDAGGREGSEKLKVRLLNEGFAVKQVFPEQVKDWNEYLVGKASFEALKQQIAAAEVFHPEKEEQGFAVKKEAGKYIFMISEITYRILGLKELFVATLKVNIKADCKGLVEIDHVDLYSAPSRARFTRNASAKWDLEEKRIANDLFRIIDYLEAERDKRLQELGQLETPIEMTEQDKKLALEFLESKDLFKQIIADMEILGYVGEEENKQIVYLASVSRYLAKPLSVYIQAGSSTGKSYLLDTVKKLIPKEQVKAVTSFSDQSLNYLKQEDLLEKVMIMGEAIYNEIVEGQIRQMQSEQELSRLVTTKDPKTGEMVTKEVRNEVKMCFMMSSTALALNPENASRCLVLHVDESSEQTAKVLEAQRQGKTFEGYIKARHFAPKIIRKHQTAQRLLEKLPVFNPFAPFLNYPKSRPAMRRSQEQFLCIISVICLLRQKQKKKVVKVDFYTNEELEGIECDLEDYRVAYELFTKAILIPNAVDLPGGAKLLYEAVRKMVKRKAKEEKLEATEITFIQRELRENTELGTDSVRKYIKSLVEYEYLQIAGGNRHGTRYCYRLREDKPINEIDVSVIPTPKQVKEAMENERNSKQGT